LKKRYDVEILGQELSVVSDSGDEHVADVIRYVSEKVAEAGAVVPGKNALKVAILAALNIVMNICRTRQAGRTPTACWKIDRNNWCV
jgi:cell division protein ZapA